MTIKEFIQTKILLPRLEKANVLVVYDAAGHFRHLCNELADDTHLVVDATESSIEAREAATAGLLELGKHNTKLQGLLVYVPTERPLEEEARQKDPFASYEACGDVFPKADGDRYLSLCLKAKPDHVTEIRRVFSQNNCPDFSVIDAIGTAAGWPVLQAKLRAHSTREVLLRLMHPLESTAGDLDADESWVDEAKELLQRSLGLKLMTRGRKWSSISDEVWRFVLFSEFVFDLPTELPESLREIPRADDNARPLIEDLCDQLRNDNRSQNAYINQAEQIQKQLNLPNVCQQIGDLGERDTFPFEERSFFAQATAALEKEDVDSVRRILNQHADSVWVGRGENSAQWQLVKGAANLIEACDDATRQLSDHTATLERLVSHYVSSLKDVDRLHREFHEFCGDFAMMDGLLKPAIRKADKAYLKLMIEVQAVYLRHLGKSGWPATGFASNAATFDRVVLPRLQESGRRVAYIMIDALRYELGVALQREMGDDAQINLQAVCSQLPSVTPIGMASLLPRAEELLQLRNEGGKAVVYLGDQPLKTGSARMKLLESQFGARFQTTSLGGFLKSEFKLNATTELLVIRTNRMDSQLEDDSDDELDLTVVRRTLKRIRAAVHHLTALGFDDAIIVTDHGFFLNTSTDAGDVSNKPPGNWVALHDRCLMGSGSSNLENYVVPATNLGIRGDFDQVAGPYGLVGYRKGMAYFHGGTSLQETIVPVIELKLKKDDVEAETNVTVKLSYRNGLKKITSRLPVLELEVFGRDEFLYGDIEVLLEARNTDGNIVGEARAGGVVSAATGTVSVKPGTSVKVPLRMDHTFEGAFTVHALNPVTLQSWQKLNLKTDYVV